MKIKKKENLISATVSNFVSGFKFLQTEVRAPDDEKADALLTDQHPAGDTCFLAGNAGPAALRTEVSGVQHCLGSGTEGKFAATKWNLAICILVLCFVGLGCTMLREARRVDPLEGSNAAMAAETLKEKIGSESRVISVEIRRDRMEITVRSEKNPKDIDKYKFVNGTVFGPDPVQVLTLGDLEMSGDKYQTVSIDEIGWDAIPETMGRAVELSTLNDARVNLISMEFNHPMHTTPPKPGEKLKHLGEVKLVFTWRLFVEGPRGRKDFWADISGNLNEKPF